MNHRKAILLILDGWGIGKKDHTDAVFNANTPFMDGLNKTVPHTTLKTFGENVGLPNGQMGNSEVGHLNIGAGRIVWQMLVRINKAFETGEIEQLEGFKQFVKDAKKGGRNIHLMGLVSDGGVHSSIEHLFQLCYILKKLDLDDKVFIHAFLDGRDTDPQSGLGFIERILSDKKIGKSRLASVVGRYYAMDRDKRWERVKKAYDLLVHGEGRKSHNVSDSIRESYKEGNTDEFMFPICMTDKNGDPLATIEKDDVVLCFNFRTDRGREITTALTQKPFEEYQMQPLPLHYYTMTEYDKTFFNVGIVFDNDNLKMTLGEVLSDKGLKQIRAAETEKYPHVTFFFSGGREEVFDGERRVMVPSPKVATYDLKPEMSAIELKQSVLEEIARAEADFICVNFANADMVGHTGVFSAMVKACETVDDCVRQIVESALKKKYIVMIIADHGNADHAVNDDGTPNTAHSMNPVPCFIIGCPEIEKLRDGILADVAPTLLKMMQLDQPDLMTGKPLF